MSARDLLAQALATLRLHPLRTGLTTFGIVWGVALSLLMAGLGDALRDSFVAELERFGMHQVFVRPGRRAGDVGGYRAGRAVQFDDRTVDALRAHCPSLLRASPQLWAGFVEVKHANRVRAFPLVGAEPDLHDIRNILPAAGRRITADDVRTGRAVCFIGDNVRKRLFGSVDPVGRTVRIANQAFTVVGVAAAKGDSLFSAGGWQDDDLVLVPVTTARRRFVAGKSYGLLALQATSREGSYELMTEVRRVVGALDRFRADDRDAVLFFNTVDNVMKVVGIQQGSLLLGTVVNLATLLLGAVGLANVLVLSVRERTAEIGVRRALGATGRTIALHFLLEALFMTLAAGSVGVAVAALVSAATGLLPLPALFTRPALPLTRVLGIYAFMVGVGLAAGVLPARRAAALDPAIAVRQEA